MTWADAGGTIAGLVAVIPIIVGGDHSLMYPDVAALTDVYGKGNVGVVHFDAHYDLVTYADFPYPYHSGNQFTKNMAEGKVQLMIGVNDVLNRTQGPYYAMGQITAHETPGRTFFARIQLQL